MAELTALVLRAAETRPTVVCCHRWWASRIEVDTLPVNHVCYLEEGHEGLHTCSCGAVEILD